MSYPPQAGTRVHTHVGDPQGGTLADAALPGLATHEADVGAHHPVDIGARVYNSAIQAIPNTSWTALTFNSERYDTDSIHSLTANTDRLTCKTAGKYLIHGQVSTEANAAGQRYLRIYLNGTTRIAQISLQSVILANTLLSITTVYRLAVDDYVTFEVYQDSGVELDSIVNAGYTPEFMMQLGGGADGALPGLATHEADVDAHHPVDIGARVYHSVDQAIANASWVYLAFDSERYDTDGIHSITTNISRLTCQTAGKYLIKAQINLQPVLGGSRYWVFFLNNTTTIAYNGLDVGFNGTSMPHLATIWDLAVGDYVEIGIYQNSGFSVNAKVSPNYASEFMMQRIED